MEEVYVYASIVRGREQGRRQEKGRIDRIVIIRHIMAILEKLWSRWQRIPRQLLNRETAYN